MIKAILLTGLALSIAAHADLSGVPASPFIAVNKPFKVKQLIQIIDDCVYAQAQSMLKQANVNGLVETPVSIDAPLEFEGSDKDDLNSRAEGPNGLSLITPMVRDMKTHWGKGCFSNYSEIGFGSTFGAMTLQPSELGKTCDDSESGPTIYTPDGTMPEVAYLPADRTAVVNNVGEEQYLDDTITKMQILLGSQPTQKIRLKNYSSGNETNVYFDPSAYVSCLQKKMGI